MKAIKSKKPTSKPPKKVKKLNGGLHYTFEDVEDLVFLQYLYGEDSDI